MQSWYLLYSKPMQERVAVENLERQGYSTYLPLIRSRKRRQTRIVHVIEPMFPRYLFLHLDDLGQDWGPIRSTLGVSRLVRFGDDAAQVPDSLIELLRSREDEQGLQRIAPSEFDRGDRVRIAEGPFAGYEALFEARNGRERVTLLLELAGNIARVVVPEGYLES